MKIQKKFIFKGNWWKYGNKDNKVFGMLEIINNKKITLQLMIYFQQKMMCILFLKE